MAVSSRQRVLLILAMPALSLLLPAIAVEVASAGGTGTLTRICAAVARFLLFYSGVFALIALTAAVAAGLLATDRIVVTPDNRILAQALHRTMSLLALCALLNHILLEVMASRAGFIDGVVPFLAARRTFYMGLGTISSDLFILVIVTGVLRRRFTAGPRPAIWRVLHAAAYACWPLAVLHGLLAGRPAKPYVDWSYGGCLALVALALTVRSIVVVRGRNSAPAQRGPARAGPLPCPPGAPAAAAQALAPVPGRPVPAAGPLRALPAPARPEQAWPEQAGRAAWPGRADTAGGPPGRPR